VTLLDELNAPTRPYEWLTVARVHVLDDHISATPDRHAYTFRKGQEITVCQWGGHGRQDRSVWWTGRDPATAFCLPAAKVAVQQYLIVRESAPYPPQAPPPAG
jgi:hypothetical protein